MKRDMDLVRSILLCADEAEGPLDALDMANAKHPYEELCYHIDLLAHHGLLDATIEHSFAERYAKCQVDGLTWEGCDYLDAIRDKHVWKRTKEVVSKAVGATTMELVREAAVMVARNAIMSALKP